MVRSLPAAGKQIVSMARALSHDARLIIMDEPSAVLAHDEVANLFRIIRELTAQGIAVIYISHRLEEIREIGDRVTVLKDGRTTAANLPARTTPDPRPGQPDDRPHHRVRLPGPARDPSPTGAELLRVEGLGRTGEFADVSLSVHAGEIVGIAGLVGSGRSELLETIFGARQAETGTVAMEGKAVPPGRVGAAVRAGMGMAPEERKSQALLLGEPIYRNVTLSTFGRYARLGFTDAGKERAEADRVAESLELRPRDVRRPVRTLSGGNQQKVVVGRWLLGDTRLLLLDEPTRGVDVGARAELYQVIRGLAAQGVGVLLVSSEVPEVLGLADRVLVMREGRVVREAPADRTRRRHRARPRDGGVPDGRCASMTEHRARRSPPRRLTPQSPPVRARRGTTPRRSTRAGWWGSEAGENTAPQPRPGRRARRARRDRHHHPARPLRRARLGERQHLRHPASSPPRSAWSRSA